MSKRIWRRGIGSTAAVVVLLAAGACTRAPAGAKWAEDLCAGTTYGGCVEGVESAVRQGWKIFAICEYAKPDGAVVLLGTGTHAEGECSLGGVNSPSKVFRVINAQQDLPPGIFPSGSG